MYNPSVLSPGWIVRLSDQHRAVFLLAPLAWACAGPGSSPVSGGSTASTVEPTTPSTSTSIPTLTTSTSTPSTSTPTPPSTSTTDDPDLTTTTEVEGALLDFEVVPPGGAFVDEVEVSLTTSDEGAVIWYTLDGTQPEPDLALRYDGPITIDQSTLLRARAVYSFGQETTLAPTFLRLEPDLDGFSTNLPLVVAWTVGEAPTDKEETYDPFTLSVFEPVEGRTSLPADATMSVRSGLKVRGSSSSGYPKKPYRIETWHPEREEDMDVALLDMPEEADWVLLAPLNFDRALMRNALIYHLSNRVGRYAPRTRFIELFVAEYGEDVGTDDYVGVYVVVERVERDAERVQIAKLEPTDIAMPEVTGGYLFKEDRTGPGEWGFTAGTAGGWFDFEQPFVFSDPEERTIPPEQENYLIGQLDELGWALASPDFMNPYTGRHYRDIIDVDSWVDHHILNVYTKNPDAFRLSGYFHKDREGLIQAGPIWDFDRTMGCEGDGRAADPMWWDNANETMDCTFVFEHGFWLGLFADPLFQERYWERMAALLATELSADAVLSAVDDMAEELSEAADRNFDRWSDYPPRDGGFDGEVSILKNWLSSRHAWMSGCLGRADPQSCIGE